MQKFSVIQPPLTFVHKTPGFGSKQHFLLCFFRDFYPIFSEIPIAAALLGNAKKKRR
jgi:hypothetical protein